MTMVIQTTCLGIMAVITVWIRQHLEMAGGDQVQQEVKVLVALLLIPAIQIQPRLKTEPILTD